jgi:hypothetical protein
LPGKSPPVPAVGSEANVDRTNFAGIEPEGQTTRLATMGPVMRPGANAAISITTEGSSAFVSQSIEKRGRRTLGSVAQNRKPNFP